MSLVQQVGQKCTRLQAISFKCAILYPKILQSVPTFQCSVTVEGVANFVGGWGFAPNSAGGAHDAPPGPLVGFSPVCAIRTTSKNLFLSPKTFRLLLRSWAMISLPQQVQVQQASKLSVCPCLGVIIKTQERTRLYSPIAQK